MEKLPPIFTGDIVKVVRRRSVPELYALILKGAYKGPSGSVYFDILVEGRKLMAKPAQLEKLPDSCKMSHLVV